MAAVPPLRTDGVRPMPTIQLKQCPICEGKPSTIRGPCPGCSGKGMIYFPITQAPPTATELLTCAACDGTGKVNNKECSVCQGTKRHFVRFCEEDLVEYNPVTDSKGETRHGTVSACERGYTWLMVQCPVCLIGHPGCLACMGSSWIPREMADAIACFIKRIPLHIHREHYPWYIQQHLDEIALLVPQSMPTRH